MLHRNQCAILAECTNHKSAVWAITDIGVTKLAAALRHISEKFTNSTGKFSFLAYFLKLGVIAGIKLHRGCLCVRKAKKGK